MSKLESRRDLMMKLTSAGVAAMVGSGAAPAQSPSGTSAPAGDIQVRLTSGAKRLAREASLQWRGERGSSADAVVLDPAMRYQEILGFGASFTDSACYMLNQLSPTAREQLLRELFHPSEMGFGVCRICLGSSDYATKMYSYDEGEPDPEMRRFSLDHDKAHILPVLRQARAVNPNLFLLGSPWSPPGWMKAGGSMLGGCMRKANFAAYAKYFVKALQGYAAEGVPLNAVTVQNETDTEQDGRMPACLWGQEYEMEFVAENLGPQLAANHIDTRIWILDHNYNLEPGTATGGEPHRHQDLDARSQLQSLGTSHRGARRSQGEPVCGWRGVARVRGRGQRDDARARSPSGKAHVLDRGGPRLQRARLPDELGALGFRRYGNPLQLVALRHRLESGA